MTSISPLNSKCRGDMGHPTSRSENNHINVIKKVWSSISKGIYGRLGDTNRPDFYEVSSV